MAGRSRHPPPLGREGQPPPLNTARIATLVIPKSLASYRPRPLHVILSELLALRFSDLRVAKASSPPRRKPYSLGKIFPRDNNIAPAPHCPKSSKSGKAPLSAIGPPLALNQGTAPLTTCVTLGELMRLSKLSLLGAAATLALSGLSAHADSLSLGSSGQSMSFIFNGDHLHGSGGNFTPPLPSSAAKRSTSPQSTASISITTSATTRSTTTPSSPPTAPSTEAPSTTPLKSPG